MTDSTFRRREKRGEERIVVGRNGWHYICSRKFENIALIWIAVWNDCKRKLIVLNCFPPGTRSKSRRRSKRDTCKCKRRISNILWKFFLIKPTRRTNFTNSILSKTLHVLGISFAHHQEFSTLYSTLVYFLQVLSQLPSSVRVELLQFHPDTAWIRSSNMQEIYQCRI
jgi:hypothetical protein